MPESVVSFPGRVFCFTGKLVDLKRTIAEREVRARGGLIVDRVNERLDYLVVGDEASPAWKHGAYGRKIEQARDFQRGGYVRPLLVSESMFFEALAGSAPTGSGDVDEKIIVCTYKFILDEQGSSLDHEAIAHMLADLPARFKCHVSARASWASVHRDLFSDDATRKYSPEALVIEYRFIRHQSLDAPSIDFISAVSKAFEGLDRVDGTLRWFERTEGSAGFVRLLAEIPQSLRAVVARD
jgi:hypothetical protein